MARLPRFSFSRWLGILVKEFIQLRRDRLTFGMMVGIPLIQLLLFGFAINSDPKHLPTAVVIADPGPFARAYVAAMENSDYFRIVGSVDPRADRERGVLVVNRVVLLPDAPRSAMPMIRRAVDALAEFVGAGDVRWPD